MKKSVTILLFVVLTILMLPIPNVFAQAYTQFSLPATYRYGHPQLTSVTTSSGKYVYVYADTVTADVYVLIFSQTGILLGTVNFDYKLLICSHGVSPNLHRLSVAEINADEVLICAVGQVEPANQHKGYFVARVNIATFSVTDTDAGTEQATNAGAYHLYTSPIFTNGTDMFGIVTMDYENNEDYECWYWAYDTTTGVLSDVYDITIPFAGQIFGFQDPDDLTKAYLIAQVEGDENRTCMLKWSFLPASQPVLLANAPFNDIWYFVHQTNDNPKYEDRYGIRYLGGGVMYNVTTTKYFVYHTWAKANSGSQNIDVIQHRLQFNESGIDASYLEDNNRVEYSFSPNTGFPTLPSSIHGGFHQQNDHDTFFVIVESRYAPITYRPRKYTIQMIDWYTFGGTTMSSVDDEWQDDIYLQVGDIVYQEPVSTFVSLEEYAHSWVRVFFGMSPPFEGYDVSALTYVPADVNPEINKRYVFSGTVTLNDIGYQSIVSIYVDDIVISSKETSSSGTFSFWMQTSVLGAHNLTVEVYDAGESKYSETTVYSFVESTADDDSQMLNLGMGGVVNFIVLFALCGVPAFLLMQQAGIMGFFAGLGLGAVIGYMGGVMPMYGLFLVGLICAVGMIYGRRTPTSTGEI